MQESLSLAKLISLLIKKVWLVILLSIIGLLLTYGYTKIFMTPLYTSSIKLYVSNSEIKEVQGRINYSDISAAQQLANTYGVIIQSDSVLEEVIRAESIQCTAARLRRMMTVKAVENTEVLEVYVTTDDAGASAKIANAIAKVAPDRIKSITKAGAVELVDKARVNMRPVSPNTRANCIIGILFGMFIAALYIILKELLDIHIKGEEDIKKKYNIPILGSIPVLHSRAKGGYYYYER